MRSISFNNFLKRRGFDKKDGIRKFFSIFFVNPFLMPPIFFWRYWNPILGYFLYSVYINIPIKNTHLKKIIIFSLSGFIFHDLIILNFYFGNTFSFIIIFILSQSSIFLNLKMHSHDNIIINLLIIILSFIIGHSLDNFIKAMI